jgi:hypothetical protein
MTFEVCRQSGFSWFLARLPEVERANRQWQSGQAIMV